MDEQILFNHILYRLLDFIVECGTSSTCLALINLFFLFSALALQYIQPHEHEKLSQVELLVVDEAAAIPLPVVKSLLGPYLVFLSSTVNGYDKFVI